MRLIYLSPVPWSSFAQRPHFMVRQLLQKGFHEVVWVDPYPARLPQWYDLRRHKSLHNQGTPLEPGIRVVKPRFLPVDPLPLGYCLNTRFVHRGFVQELQQLLADEHTVLGIGKPSCLAVDLLGTFCGHASFYDAMDDFPEFHQGISKQSVKRNESAIARKINILVCSSEALSRKFNTYATKRILIENAFDDQLISVPQHKAVNQAPVIGYIGSFGRWFDWDALMLLANAATQCKFRLVGPLLSSFPSRLPGNISMLPPCRHNEVPHYLSTFDIGLIPFVRNKLTESVDPVKFYEYYASGIPVITTRFGQMQYRSGTPGVFFVDEGSPESVVNNALGYAADRYQLMAWRAANNWSIRFNSLSQILQVV